MELFGMHIDDYLDYCRYSKRLSSKTLIAYKTDLKQLSAHVGTGKDASEKDTLKEYISLLHQTYKSTSIKRKIASVRAYYNYLADENIIDFNPLSLLRIKLREEKKLPKTLLFHTVWRLLDCVYEKYRSDAHPALLRDILIIELLFATGMRVSELCSLKDEDVDITAGKINIFGKGSKERIVQVCNSEVLAKLLEYRQVYDAEINATGYFFVNRLRRRFSEQSARHMICHYAKAAGIMQHITPHMFRHTFATLLLEEDVDIRYIQKMLGHSSIRTTEIYTHVALEKQKEILALKHPRNKMTLGL
ncbi:MAG: tyrosine-type recombinase/integrase [Clostridiales Family XIII bacterium]|jgi:integrase/recombinase XerD|nr:tyrosine-type recombinase/integrase [Clostridiales Family XIII bacterium]